MNLRKDQLYESKIQTLNLVALEASVSCARRKISVFATSSPFFQPHYFSKEINITLQLLAMDVSAQATMKDAAKCDKRCEWQNSANQENVERILHF